MLKAYHDALMEKIWQQLVRDGSAASMVDSLGNLSLIPPEDWFFPGDGGDPLPSRLVDLNPADCHGGEAVIAACRFPPRRL